LDKSPPISLNKPYSYRIRDQGGLQVFTTSPAAEHVRFCGKGNAVYDSMLDAVFIDEQIVYPTDWKQLLATPDGGWGLDIPLTLDDAPWLHVYLRFVILHELGHRQLHRHVASVFDLGPNNDQAAQRRRETDADDFAIARMRTAYKVAGQYGIRPVEEYTGNTINFEVTDHTPIADQVQASLVEMAQDITQGRLVLPSTTSPLRDDFAHPSYLDRSASLVRQSLLSPSSDPDLMLFTDYISKSLERMKEASQSGIVELTAKQPVSAIQFDSRGLLVFTKGLVQRVSYADLKRLLTENRPGLVDSLAQGIAVDGRVLGVSGDPDVAGFWSSDDVGTMFLWSDGQETIIPEDFHHPRTERLDQRVTGFRFERVISGAQPAPGSLAVAHDSMTKWLVAFQRDRISAMRKLDDLEAQFRSVAPAGTTADMEHAQIVAGQLLLTLLAPGAETPTIWGWADIDLNTLELRKLGMLSIPREMSDFTSSVYNPLLTPKSGDRFLAYIPDAHGTSPILINIVRYPPTNKYLSGRGIKWQAWHLSAQDSPALLSENVFLSDYFNRRFSPTRVDDLAITPRLPTGGVVLVPPSSILVNIENDSVQLLDAGNTGLLFHPGSDQISARASSSGLVALSVRGGYQVFLLRMRLNESAGNTRRQSQ
jgi:hypothetical protein